MPGTALVRERGECHLECYDKSPLHLMGFLSLTFLSAVHFVPPCQLAAIFQYSAALADLNGRWNQDVWIFLSAQPTIAKFSYSASFVCSCYGCIVVHTRVRDYMEIWLRSRAWLADQVGSVHQVACKPSAICSASRKGQYLIPLPKSGD